MAKLLIRVSMALKNVSTLPRYFSTTRLCRNSNQLPALNNEVTKTTVATTPRELFDILKQNNEPSFLLSSIATNKQVVDGRHVVMALTSMHKFYKTHSVPPAEIQNSQDFKVICSVLNKHVRTLQMPQLLQAIKILSLIKVPVTTVIMQSLFQIVRSSVNDLLLSDIFFLTFLLKTMEPSPLGNALITALPQVFMAQYRLQLDINDIKELKNSLRFASDYVQNQEVIQYIVDAIENFRGEIDFESALHMFWSFSNIYFLPDNYLKIITKLIRVIENNVDMIKPHEVLRTLSDIAVKESMGVPGFYKASLVDELVQRMIKNDCGFEKTIFPLNNINKMNHINLKLLDYLSSQCCQDTKILSTCHPQSLLTLSEGFAKANYKPKNWDVLKNALLENHVRLPDIKHFFDYAINLASLDCFDSRILSQAFNLEYKLGLINSSYACSIKRLYYYAKFFYPEYSGAWPPNEIMEFFENSIITGYEPLNSYPLLSALQYILKDSSFIKTNVMTKEGIHIDHLLLLNDSEPVAFESAESEDSTVTTTNVEDLNIPAGLKRVAVLFIPAKMYGKNIKILRAHVESNIKLLEALSYQVAAVSQELWDAMPEDEMIPHLLRLLDIEKKK